MKQNENKAAAATTTTEHLEQIIYLPALYPSAMVMEIRVVKLYNAIMMANEMTVSISIELEKTFLNGFC